MTTIRRKKYPVNRKACRKLALAAMLLAGVSGMAQAANAATCVSTTVTWTVGAETCTGSLAEGDSTLTLPYEVATDNGDAGNHGSKVYRCNNAGSWVDTWSNAGGDPANMATCVANGTPALKVTQVGVIDPVSLPCVNGYSPPPCSFVCDATTVGQICNAGYCDDSGDITKHFRSFSCDDAGGASPPPPTSICAAQTVTWTVNGQVCNGSTIDTSHLGVTPPVSDSTLPTTGNATYSCNNGALTELPGAVCNGPPPPPASCPGTTTSWTVGLNTCSGSVPTSADSTAVVATDAYPLTTGTANMICNNGVWSMSGETCTSPSPPVCPPPPPTPQPPASITAGCFVDTWDLDYVSAGSCYADGCTGTNAVVFSVGTHTASDFYMFADPDRFTVVWSGDCTGTNSTCSITPSGSGTFNALATVTDTINGTTSVHAVNASKSTTYRVDPLTCPVTP